MAKRQMKRAAKPKPKGNLKKSSKRNSSGPAVPITSKARKKMLAEQEQLEFEHELDREARKPNKRSHLTSPTRPGVVERRNIRAKRSAAKDRVARSGSTKIQGHLAAANRRAQARRDEKQKSG